MAASGSTPLSLYYSATASNVPLAANLVAGELAINTNDGKLFYKDSSGVVQTIASKAGNVNVSSFSGGTTGLTPNTATTGAVTLAGTLAVANGGTGQTTASAAFNALSPVTSTGDLIVGNGTNSATRLGIGTNGYVLTSNGTTASWQASTGGVTSFQTSLSGLTPSSSTTGAVTLAGTLGATSGGTAQSTYATGDMLYASATNTLSKLTAGTNGYVMTLAGGVPTWAAAAGGGASITNDTTTASNLYPLFAAATSGTPSTIYTSNAKYLYKPSTGELVASEHVASNGIMVNSATVSASYTIATGYNAMSVGPVSVASGQSVTVSSGQRWVIL